jgi:XRE family aerobic/anaerobic benzoate catabolism transcriptional regulator
MGLIGVILHCVDPDRLLDELGRRVRETRTARGWTLRELSEKSGVSLRFLVQLEAGDANISVRRLAQLSSALETTPAALLADGTAPRVPTLIALLGLRGAGKTTVGRRLARRLHVRFVELDKRIAHLANLTVPEIFSMHGEDYYRRLEREALLELLESGGSMVLATGGGIVTSPDTFALLRGHALTIWLKATPETHWNRVVKQGDRRPMANHPQAMHDLRALLATREPLYSSAALTVDTTSKTADEVVKAVERLVQSTR